MKKMILAGIVLSLAVMAASSPALAAIEVEGDAYIGGYDKYLWRGFNLSGGQPVIQGGVDLSAKGFALSYWTNVQASSDNFDKTDSTDDYTAGEVTETDITFSYSFDLGELVSVSVGNIYYILQFPGLVNTNEIYLSVGLNTLLSPAISIYHDWDEAEEDGMFYTASVGHSFDLSDSLSLSLGALVSYNGESDYAVGDYSDWHNYELSAGVDYAINEQFSVSPSVVFSSPISDDAKHALDSEVAAGIKVTMTF